MGSAHVEFANIAGATKVFEAHKAKPLYIAGRTVHVNYAAHSILDGNLPLDKYDERAANKPIAKQLREMISVINCELENRSSQ